MSLPTWMVWVGSCFAGVGLFFVLQVIWSAATEAIRERSLRQHRNARAIEKVHGEHDYMIHNLNKRVLELESRPAKRK